MNIRLSVVMPGYCTADSLWRRSIGSVLRNLRSDDEVICVDDGSPVVSAVLDEMSLKDPRVMVVRLPENRGQAVARNAGLDKARGEFIAFVDSDDELLEGAYSHALTAIARDKSDIVVYGVKVVWINDGLYKDDVSDDRNIGEMSALELKRLKEMRLFNYPWNKVYRKEFLVRSGVRFKEECIPREDEIFNLDCVVAGAKWTVISFIGHVYYHADGTSLARYRRYDESANLGCNAAWRRCKRHLGKNADVLGDIGEMSERELALSSWKNMWRRESPFVLLDRWRWLHKHPELGGVVLFAKTAAFFFARHHLYFRPIRRWHLKKILPEIKEWKPE